MTLAEATDLGLQRIRRGLYAPGAYLRLDLRRTVSGRIYCAPEAMLFERITQEINGDPTPQRIYSWQITGDDFEAYQGPIDGEDRAEVFIKPPSIEVEKLKGGSSGEK